MIIPIKPYKIKDSISLMAPEVSQSYPQLYHVHPY